LETLTHPCECTEVHLKGKAGRHARLDRALMNAHCEGKCVSTLFEAREIPAPCRGRPSLMQNFGNQVTDFRRQINLSQPMMGIDDAINDDSEH
jgi:hypothetical protein